MSIERPIEGILYQTSQNVYLAAEAAKVGVEKGRVVQLVLGFLGLVGVALALTLPFTLDVHHFVELKQLMIADKWKIIVGAVFGLIVSGSSYYYAYRKKLEEEQNLKIKLHYEVQLNTEKSYPSQYEYVKKVGIEEFGFPDLDVKIKASLIEKLKKLDSTKDYSALSIFQLRKELSELYKKNNDHRLPDIEEDLLKFLKKNYETLYGHKPGKTLGYKDLVESICFMMNKNGAFVSPHFEEEVKDFLKQSIWKFCGSNIKVNADLHALSEQDLKEVLLNLYLDYGYGFTTNASGDINKCLRSELRDLCIKYNIDYDKLKSHTMSELDLKNKIFEILANPLMKRDVEKAGWIGFWICLSLTVALTLFITLYPDASDFVEAAIGLPGLVAFFTVTSSSLLCYGLYRTYNTMKIKAHYEEKPEPVRPLAVAINLSIVALFAMSILGIAHYNSEIFDADVLAGSAIFVGVAAMAYCYGRFQFSKQTDDDFKSFFIAFALLQTFICLGVLALLGHLNLYNLGWGVMGAFLSFIGIGFMYHSYKGIKNYKERHHDPAVPEPTIKLTRDQFERYTASLKETWNNFMSYINNMKSGIS